MAMVINTNIMSLNAQNNLRTSQGDMNTAMERLSSGKRVNSAADDAAGLAIINRFTSQERGLNMAIRNANDGISMIQTAEGALDETTNILQRMRELSIQSANGIYSDANRATLNAEVTQLKAELTRIAETTSFNGLKILDGTLGDIELQVGAESGERINVNLGTGFDAESLGTTGGVTENTGTFELIQSTTAVAEGSSGTLAAVEAGDLLINGIEIGAAADYDSLSTSDNGASALGLAAAINDVTADTGVTASASNDTDLGEITVSNWVDMGAITVTDADATGGAVSATYVSTPLDLGVYDDTDGTGQTINDAYNFTVSIGGTTAEVDFGTADIATQTGSDIATLIQTELQANGLTGVTVSFDNNTGSFEFTDVNNLGDVGEQFVFEMVGSSSTTLGFASGAQGDARTDADATVTVAAGELYVNGTDMAGTYDITDMDSLVNDLNTTYGTDIFATDGTNLFAQMTDGADVQVVSTGAFVSGDSFTLAGDAFGAGAVTGDYANAGTTLGAGDLTINGVDVTGTIKTTDDLVAAINQVSGDTGVTATYAAGNLNLESIDGRNIQIETQNTGVVAATDLNDASPAYAAGVSIADLDLTAASDNTYAGTVSLTGVNVEVTGENTAGFSTQTLVSALTDTAGTPADTFTDMTNGDLAINGYTVDFDGFNGTENSSDDGNASAMTIAGSINTTSGLKDEVTATALTVMNLGEISAGAIDALDLTINGEAIDFGADRDVLDGDADGSLVGTINSVLAASGNADAVGIIASVNDDGELILTAEDGRNLRVEVTTAGAEGVLANIDTTDDTVDVMTRGTIVLEANEGFSVDEVSGDNVGLAGIISSGSEAIANIDISTQQGAQDALAVVDRALDYIADSRGDLGAASNRLEFTINNLSSVVENAASARSRVQDADFAVESAMLARAQVLQQAGTAMLAQANAAPQSVLSLLQ